MNGLSLSLRLATGTLLLTTGLLFYVTGCAPKVVKNPAPTPVESATMKATFTGDEACRPCHPDISREHDATHHANTMRLVNKESLKDQYPKPGKTSNLGYITTEEEGVLSLAWLQDPSARLPLRYVLGSGKLALTFLSPYEGGSLIESRVSYIPKEKRWFFTPGQNRKQSAELGIAWEHPIAQKCISCHTSTLSEEKWIPEPKFFGVGCEACHGAGSKHISAMQKSKDAPMELEDLSKMGGKGINDLCGRCHRTEKDLTASGKESTQRFQPYGISISKCFKNSSNSLTCMTCHNPHKDADTNASNYKTTCLSCHTPNQAPPTKLTRVVACPVQPKGNCVPCHMPPKPLRGKETGATLEMADHYIRPHKP
jgi:hypothetical protein